MSIPINRYQVPEFNLDVSLGRVEGHKTLNFAGIRTNQSIASGSITIWDAGELEGSSGNISFLSSASNMWIASTNVADTQPILIQGLSNDYTEIEEVVVLSGQTAVSLLNSYRHILFCRVASPTATLGDVYIASSSSFTLGIPVDLTTIQSKILAGKGVTRNGFTVIPKGYKGVLLSLSGTTDASTKPADIELWIKNPNIVEFNPFSYSVSPGFGPLNFSLPSLGSIEFAGQKTFLLSVGTIVEAKSTAIANNTKVLFAADIMLIEDRFLV